MAAGSQDAAAEVARVRTRLAAAAAGATPLAELDPSGSDLTRVQPLLEQLAAAVARLLGTDFAVVWTTQPHRDVLVPSAWVGFPDDYIAGLQVPFGTGSAGRAVAERRVVLVQDVGTSPHYGAFRDGAMAQGVRAALSVPMLTLGGEPMGALSSYYRESVVPQQRDLDLVDLYARQAAEIVERARLHSEARALAARERRRGQQLRALADSALALAGVDDLEDLLRRATTSAREVVGCRLGAALRTPGGGRDAIQHVSGPDEDTAQAGCLPCEDQVAAVVRDNRPLREADCLAAPLVGGDGRNLGVLSLAGKLDGTPFSPDDEAILVQLAQMTSSTVERLESHERERQARRVAEQAAQAQRVLSAASALFAERFDPGGIARALVDLAVPRLAELALLHVVGPDGAVALAALQTSRLEERGPAMALVSGLAVDAAVGHGVAAVLRTGQTHVLPKIGDDFVTALTTDDAQAEALRGLLRTSGICVPLIARGRTIGVLSLSRDEVFTPADADHVLDLARRAALALDNASRYAFERDLAVTLQRSLLPSELPTGRGFRAAARYLAGARGTEVGGDWYDVVELDDDLVLVVGDVVGRGVRAAAVMGRLQATVRAYALEGHSPAAVLDRLGRVVEGVPDLNFTTCIVLRLELATGRLVVASAGHPPPVVTGPDGGARLLDLDPGVPLGVGGHVYVDQVFTLEPDGLVLLYTDGLVEQRGESLTAGLARLVASLAAPVGSPDEACERVLRALGRDTGNDDDTALLVVQRTGEDRVELRLPRLPTSARVARQVVREVLQAADLLPDTGELLASALVGDAVRHGDGPDRALEGASVVLRVSVRGRTLRVEVRDTSTRPPRAGSSVAAGEATGQGLLLVTELADRWGVDVLPFGGTAVWFELTEPGSS